MALLRTSLTKMPPSFRVLPSPLCDDLLHYISWIEGHICFTRYKYNQFLRNNLTLPSTLPQPANIFASENASADLIVYAQFAERCFRFNISEFFSHFLDRNRINPLKDLCWTLSLHHRAPESASLSLFCTVLDCLEKQSVDEPTQADQPVLRRHISRQLTNVFDEDIERIRWAAVTDFVYEEDLKEIVTLQLTALDLSYPSPSHPSLSDSLKSVARLFHLTSFLLPCVTDLPNTSVLITGLSPTTTYEDLHHSIRSVSNADSATLFLAEDKVYAIVTFPDQFQAKTFTHQAQGYNCESGRFFTAQGHQSTTPLHLANSVLQALSHSTLLTSYFISYDFLNDYQPVQNRYPSFSPRYAQLMQNVWADILFPAISHPDLVDTLDCLSPDLPSIQQYDAYRFLDQFLARLVWSILICFFIPSLFET